MKIVFQKIKTISEEIAISDTYIKNITINEITYNHGFSGDCVVTFNKKESTATKVTDEQLYFNLKDLGKNMVKFYTEGKNVKIELQTKAGNKFVKHTVNQELKVILINLKWSLLKLKTRWFRNKCWNV